MNEDREKQPRKQRIQREREDGILLSFFLSAFSSLLSLICVTRISEMVVE